MFINQDNITVSQINLACLVLPGSGIPIHKNRSSHGFILNDSVSEKDYCFSDGTILKTRGNDFFYLPEGSSYEVKTLKNGSCYAINFDADLLSEPFCLNFRNNEKVLKIFKDCEKEWREKSPFYQITIKNLLYELIVMIIKEHKKNYLPENKSLIIAPALKKIRTDFTRHDLSVSELSFMCNVSEVYFRKIFIDKFGISPKEYIIKLRIDYAKELLKSNLFSVSEVANLCGYTEPCHFSREFKKRTGESPNNYK